MNNAITILTKFDEAPPSQPYWETSFDCRSNHLDTSLSHNFVWLNSMDPNTIPFDSVAFACPWCEASLQFRYNFVNTFHIVNRSFDHRDILTVRFKGKIQIGNFRSEIFVVARALVFVYSSKSFKCITLLKEATQKKLTSTISVARVHQHTMDRALESDTNAQVLML